MNTKFTMPEIVIREDEFNIQVKDIIRRRSEITEELKLLSLGKQQKILDFTESNDQGFTEYVEGVYIKNMTTPLLHLTGITILYVEVAKEVKFDLHEHDNQAQVVYVSEGRILTENKIEFFEGESYFVSKTNRHSVTYFPGTKVILVYLPNLNIVKV